MNIKEKRLEKKITQEEIARLLDITLRAYQNIEKGKCTTNIRTGLHLAKILDIDPYELFPLK